MNFFYKILIFLAMLTNQAFALTPEKYYEIELQSKQIALQAMKDKLVCLNSNNCTQSKQNDIEIKTQQKLLTLYQKYQTTFTKKLEYYVKNRNIVDQYYTNNTIVQTLYKSILQEFEEINQQIIERMENQ